MSLADPPIPGDILQVKAFCYQIDQVGINIRHYRVLTVAGAGALLQEIADQLSTEIADEYKAMMATSASYKGLTVQSIYPTPKGVAHVSDDGNGAGVSIGSALPSQVSGMITLTSAVAGRQGRGRIYVPFPAEEFNSDDLTPTAGYVALLDNLAAVWSADFTTAGIAGNTTIRPVLIRNGNPATTYDVVSYLSRDKWATQRRRGNYGTPNPLPF